MRYNAKWLKINVVISGNDLLFKGVKISLGLLIIAREMPALFRENHFLEVSTTANNRITVSAVEPKIPSKSKCLASYQLSQHDVINYTISKDNFVGLDLIPRNLYSCGKKKNEKGDGWA